MSIHERSTDSGLPVMITSALLVNALGRYTFVRLGIANHHSLHNAITFKNDTTRTSERGEWIPIILSGECGEFGQV